LPERTRNVAFNDYAVLSGGWFRDKDERVMPRRLPERIRQEERNQRRGNGVVKIKGFLIFARQTKLGEQLKVRIPRVERKFAIAEKLSQTEEKN